MRVLFVSRSKGSGISPIVEKQGQSLVAKGIKLTYHKIERSDFLGCFQEILKLRKLIRASSFDIIHAHYSHIGILTAFALFPKKIIVSLMGSDTKSNRIYKWIIKLMSKFIWRYTIVKSQQMSEGFDTKRVKVIPNGVDFDYFSVLPKNTAMSEAGFSPDKKHVLFFLSHSNRHEKNINLATQAMTGFNEEEVEFHIISYVEPTRVPILLNAANVLLLTSFHEGSPNIIKEAMACCLPIVSTDVGDVRKVMGLTEGCYICSYDVNDVREKVKTALAYGRKTEGRSHIKYLDSKLIAEQLLALYQERI